MDIFLLKTSYSLRDSIIQTSKLTIQRTMYIELSRISFLKIQEKILQQIYFQEMKRTFQLRRPYNSYREREIQGKKKKRIKKARINTQAARAFIIPDRARATTSLECGTFTVVLSRRNEYVYPVLTSAVHPIIHTYVESYTYRPPLPYVYLFNSYVTPAEPVERESCFSIADDLVIVAQIVGCVMHNQPPDLRAYVSSSARVSLAAKPRRGKYYIISYVKRIRAKFQAYRSNNTKS